MTLGPRKLIEEMLVKNSEDEIGQFLENITGDPRLSWHPLGGNENNFGVIENQQASPIAALIEKLTNSIDAILMRRCLEAGIDPKSSAAPDSMHRAIETFFSADHKNWHLTGVRRKQAESIQILASGTATAASRQRPCLTIYDDGEGQHPENFEKTFLSLLQGNKNEIAFVQGKYNMGGTGAIVFCGEHRYQLIGSRRFDGTGDFGFTLIRRHQLSPEEKKTKKNTWYEYLKIDGNIPSFPIAELDLGLAGRKFTTGTIIKLFDYQLPAGSRGGLPQEVRRALNQFLFEPALPIYLKDSPERYPNNKVLEGDTFGLKRRLEEDDNRYIQGTPFTETLTHKGVGTIKASCYVFKAKIDGKSVKETRDAIDKEFFPDGMCVLFSLNGQVHGHLGTQFISGTLKMPLLKNHLLIHVDCTGMDYDFRSELFMASRDRLKAGEKTAELRQMLRDLLTQNDGRLVEIYKQRKNAISVEGGDAKDLLKSFSKNLPFNKDLLRLLNQTFKIEHQDEEKKKPEKPEKPKEKKHKEPFHPQRYPSFFKLKGGEGKRFLTIPERDEKTIQFSTDVEDSYFDRSEDPGELKISILQRRTNETEGGTAAGAVDAPEELLDIRKTSPKEGTIRIGLGATSELKAGDELEIQATLGGPEDFECRFWVKIVEPNKEPKEVKKPDEEDQPMGLPELQLVFKEPREDHPDDITWDKLAEVGVEMDWNIPMYPSVGEDGSLDRVYINVDCSILRNYISRQGPISVEQHQTSENKFISSVYFHAIFLFSITKNKKYDLKQGEKDVDLQDYLKDVFSSYYSEFLLNFGMEDLISTMAD